MTLDDFEKYFDDTILQRARSYYKSGYVVSLEEEDDGEWAAEVEGNELYTVMILLNGREILDTECDCPYDFGPYCKHQGAVLFALREQFKSQSTSTGDEQKTKKVNLQTLLSALKKDELIALLLEYAQKNKHIKNELLLKYSDKSDIAKYARGLIKNAVNAVKRDGFVEYRDTRKAVKGAEAVLNMIDEKIGKQELFNAALLCTVVLEETLEFIQYCDDSNGDCGYIVAEAIARIAEIADMDGGGRNDSAFFDLVFKHAASSRYDGWSNWRMDILCTLIPLCHDKSIRERLENYLASSDGIRTGNWGEDYDRRQRQELLLEIVKRFDGETAGEQYIETHIDNEDFRKRAIHTALSRKQYERALQLCFDGERIDEQYAGLVRDYKKLRYRVYEETGDTVAQRALAKEFLLDGNFAYFEKLKGLVKSTEWIAVRDELLEKTRNKQPPRDNPWAFGLWHESPVYLKMLVAEKLTAKLLAYCEQKIGAITEYGLMLKAEYPKEVDDIFKRYIFKYAEQASDRGAYQKVCAVLRQYQELFGVSAIEIRDQLKEKYQKRPAFLDELSRIK